MRPPPKSQSARYVNPESSAFSTVKSASAPEPRPSNVRRSTSPAEAFAAIGDNDSVVFPSGYDPVLSSATTPRDMTTLLSAVWTGAVLSGEQTAFVRAVMASQVFTARLRSGFPFADVVVAGKTGTLGAVRNEVGVIEFPDGDSFAVAVFTRAARADALLPRADAAVGLAARTAIAELRKRG